MSFSLIIELCVWYTIGQNLDKLDNAVLYQHVQVSSSKIDCANLLLLISLYQERHPPIETRSRSS